MKYCALICEYNPLHNGHRLQLDWIRRLSGCDKIICIMSGDFVQRAEPAIANKLERAKCALLSGADLVIELPLPYATGSGEMFAKGAIEILSKLPAISVLAMGCETDYVSELQTLANIQYEECDDFKNMLDNHLKQGLSYAQSYASATEIVAENMGIARSMSRIILSKPNNVLCLEYLKALKRKELDIKPLIMKRKADGKYKEENTEIASSSAIRKQILTGDICEISQAVPLSTFEMLKHELPTHCPSAQTYSDIVIHALKAMSLEEIRSLSEVSEGLEYAIRKAASTSVDLQTLISQIKSKRYTESRLKRICLQALFKLDKGIMSGITPVYSRILAVKNDFRDYLSRLPEEFYIQSKDSASNSSQKSKFIELEKKATALYALITHNAEYTYPPRLITD